MVLRDGAFPNLERLGLGGAYGNDAGVRELSRVLEGAQGKIGRRDRVRVREAFQGVDSGLRRQSARR